MVVVPEDTPVTIPALLIVATPVLLLLHTPPLVVLLNIIVDPTHTLVFPVIGLTTGLAYTVTSLVTTALQPAALLTI